MAFYLHHPIPQASADQCQKGDQPTGSPRGGKAKQVEHWIPPAFLKAEGPAEGPEGPAAPHRTQITGEFSIAETPEKRRARLFILTRWRVTPQATNCLASEDSSSLPHVGLKSSHHSALYLLPPRMSVFRAVDPCLQRNQQLSTTEETQQSSYLLKRSPQTFTIKGAIIFAFKRFQLLELVLIPSLGQKNPNTYHQKNLSTEIQCRCNGPTITHLTL